MKFAKLLDDAGRPIREPVAVLGSVSFDAREGVAQAWTANGRSLVAEMVKARVVWMGAAGTRLEGMEPVEGPDGRTSFDTPQQAFRVLAGVGIRSAIIEWDGLDAITE